jgi:N-sulfoglucosamine sulfohydrolase
MINTRAIARFLTYLAALFCLTLPTLSALDRPHILWLVSEDNGPFLGCYGDPDARTPNLDQLAAEGIRFDNAFANAPVCAVARFTIITGTHGTRYAGPTHMRNLQVDLPATVRYFPEYLRDAGYYTTNNPKTDYNPDISALKNAAWNQSGNAANWTNRGTDQPFFSVFNYFVTHESNYFFTGITSTTTNQNTVTLPPIHPDTASARMSWSKVHDRMALMDAQVGNKIQELTNAGLLEDTIIFYYSDHGGPLAGGKRHANDFGLRVPLLVRIPENWAHLFSLPRGSVVEDPVSFADLAPTVLSLAGVPIPAYLQGRVFTGINKAPAPDYVPFYRGRMAERADVVRGVQDANFRYVRNYIPDLPEGRSVNYRSRNSLAKEWAYLFEKDSLTVAQSRYYQPKPFEALYDLNTDRWETNNLAQDPDYSAQLQAMSAATDQFILENRDTGFIPEGSVSHSRNQAASESSYPLQATILELAGKAASRDPAYLPDLTSALSHSNYIVRYWGALGCAHLGTAALPAQALLEAQLADPEPSAATAAAWALCRMGATAPHGRAPPGRLVLPTGSLAINYPSTKAAFAFPVS